MTTPPNFEDISQHWITLEELEGRLGGYFEAMKQAKGDASGFLEAFEGWMGYSKEVSTQSSLAYLRFAQDTRDERATKVQDHYDEVRAKAKTWEAKIKEMILASSHAERLKESHGGHLVGLWRSEIESTSPEVEAEAVAIGRLDSAYEKLLSGAEIEVRGEVYNLSQMRAFAMEADRELREEAERAKWAWFAAHREELDRVFGELVELRHTVAKKLGYENYIEVGYKRMQRTDYGPEQVAAFRQEIREVIVPLASALRQKQAKALGVEKVMAWDLEMFGTQGSPRPGGDKGWMVERAKEMFGGIGHKLDTFFGMMVEGNYLDLEARKGKAGGGFCTGFPSVGMPFVFANFNGTLGDVDVFTHEMGHAFQSWSSSGHELLDYQWPTADACEIHSMSLEFLCYPWMELFFGNEAARYRQEHLMGAILFLPYGAAVDHFQHVIYENPTMTPAERHETWRQMEQTYMPWLDWGGWSTPRQAGAGSCSGTSTACRFTTSITPWHRPARCNSGSPPRPTSPRRWDGMWRCASAAGRRRSWSL